MSGILSPVVEIKVDGEATAHTPTQNTGDPGSFRYVHEMTGTVDARWMHVEIKASAGGITITREGFTYVPPVSESLAYDDDGNLTQTAQWTYTWDAENRLTRATQKALPVASGFTAPLRKQLRFAYDSRNRRIAKAVAEERVLGSDPETV